MISQIVTGRGNARQVTSIPRDRKARRIVAGILTKHLLPTQGAANAAAAAGRKRAKKHKG